MRKLAHHVPIINVAVPNRMSVGDMVECAKGKSRIADTQKEGLVWRGYDKTHFKVINPEYLLKHET